MTSKCRLYLDEHGLLSRFLDECVWTMPVSDCFFFVLSFVLFVLVRSVIPRYHCVVARYTAVPIHCSKIK
jgi:hypothetical protein